MAALTLKEIVACLGGEAVGEVAAPLTGVATLDSAGPSEIAFLANPKYRAKLASTRAGAVILGPGDRDAAAIPRIVSENPYAYYARTVALFHPQAPVKPGTHPTAQVDANAYIDPGAEVGAFAVIGPRSTIGKGARIGAHCVIGQGVAIGADSTLHPRVTIYDGCRIGERVIVHSGAVIGADGFGMARDAGRWVKIPQVGGVRIDDDVEIGANTTIDRGALDDTVIEEGAKLDNHPGRAQLRDRRAHGDRRLHGDFRQRHDRQALHDRRRRGPRGPHLDLRPRHDLGVLAHHQVDHRAGDVHFGIAVHAARRMASQRRAPAAPGQDREGRGQGCIGRRQ